MKRNTVPEPVTRTRMHVVAGWPNLPVHMHGIGYSYRSSVWRLSSYHATFTTYIKFTHTIEKKPSRSVTFPILSHPDKAGKEHNELLGSDVACGYPILCFVRVRPAVAIRMAQLYCIEGTHSHIHSHSHILYRRWVLSYDGSAHHL